MPRAGQLVQQLRRKPERRWREQMLAQQFERLLLFCRRHWFKRQPVSRIAHVRTVMVDADVFRGEIQRISFLPQRAIKAAVQHLVTFPRSEEHTSELQSLTNL